MGEIFLRVLVHLDAYFFSSINAESRFNEMLNRSGSGREFLQKPFFVHLFLKLWAIWCFIVHQSSHDDCHEVAPS